MLAEVIWLLLVRGAIAVSPDSKVIAPALEAFLQKGAVDLNPPAPILQALKDGVTEARITAAGSDLLASLRDVLVQPVTLPITNRADAVTFTLRLQVSAAEIGVAVFDALKASGWALYQSTVLAWLAHNGHSPGPPSAERPFPTLEQRLGWARDAFEWTCSLIGPENPYRRELERYATEVVPRMLRTHPIPTPSDVG